MELRGAGLSCAAKCRSKRKTADLPSVSTYLFDMQCWLCLKITYLYYLSNNKNGRLTVSYWRSQGWGGVGWGDKGEVLLPP